MAHCIKRSIELDGFADQVHEQWLRFEALPRCAAHAPVGAGTRWRAEVMTFRPLGDRTQVELRIDLEPGSADPGLPRRMDAFLEAFASFCAGARARAHESQPA